jgi:hypothetical protein
LPRERIFFFCNQLLRRCFFKSMNEVCNFKVFQANLYYLERS